MSEGFFSSTSYVDWFADSTAADVDYFSDSTVVPVSLRMDGFSVLPVVVRHELSWSLWVLVGLVCVMSWVFRRRL